MEKLFNFAGISRMMGFFPPTRHENGIFATFPLPSRNRDGMSDFNKISILTASTQLASDAIDSQQFAQIMHASVRLDKNFSAAETIDGTPNEWRASVSIFVFHMKARTECP